MNKKDIILLLTGIIMLIVLGIFANNSIKNESVHNANHSQTVSDKPVHKQAAQITKSECNPKMWGKWEEKEVETEENTIGIAPVMAGTTNNKSYVEIELFIDNKLTNQEQITHTAWHECAHAKTYIVENNEIEELYNRTMIAFADCEYAETECLADAMTEIKVPGTMYHYYQKEFTAEQLDIAEKVWEASNKAKPYVKFKGKSWMDMETTKHDQETE